MSCTRRRVEDRTPRRTHIFLSFVSVAHILSTFDLSHAHACGSRHDWDVLHICAPLKSSTLTACVIDNFSTYLTHFRSCCSTPPPSTPNSLLMTGIWRSSCATPSGGLLFGHPAESSPPTGYKPKTCIDVNSEHTPLNYTSRRNSFNIENNDLTTTTAASDNSDGFHQQAAASGSPQRAPASVVNPWLGADTWSSTR